MNLMELLLTLMVALIAFGPKKLPMLAHHLGRLAARLNVYQQQWTKFYEAERHAHQLQENIKKAAAAELEYQKKL